MLTLCDFEAIDRAWFGGPWKAVALSELPEGVQKVWCALAPDPSQVWAKGEVSEYQQSVGILIRESADSQFDILAGLLDESSELPPWIVCAALTGQRFHGNRGRAWMAERGNLHFTAYGHVGLSTQHVGLGMTALPAWASAETIDQLVALPGASKIKWVNDILVNHQKVSGVITRTVTRADLIERAVFGIGLNVKSAPSIQSIYVPASGCIADFNQKEASSLPQAFELLNERLQSGLARLKEEGSRWLIEAYRERSIVMGQAVVIWDEEADPDVHEPLYRGTVTGISDDLSLELDHDPAKRVGKGRLAFASQLV